MGVSLKIKVHFLNIMWLKNEFTLCCIELICLLLSQITEIMSIQPLGVLPYNFFVCLLKASLPNQILHKLI